ncbi:hypothetical protein [Limimaricola cinnabarinus]|jgi:hypothetical protein|uniref:Uncharacterized protein n=1 Tax=Limimaricola cinnabarinus TaxID=1125964 RepID=A0A2G1MFH1_9RHOB|nr:hypothetical protein [Limimaricola cinnabarinus]PHP27503.1 hypothetical protein CJ301_10755 [Limimaricola cinnabarinus]
MTDNRDLPARLVPPGSGELGRSHWHVTELGLAVVEELAGRGCHVATIARALGMSKDAFKSCRDRQPEVDEAYHRGLAREHDQLVSNLRAAADDGNIVANIFLLKARHQYREGEALDANVNVNFNPGGVVVVPQRQTIEEFLEEQREREANTIEGEVVREARRGD